MIADLDRTIEQLLIAEIPIRNGEIDIKFDQPKREWSARLSRPTINLFLYDVRENNILRKHQWQKMAGNGRIDPNIAHRKRTPFRVDCHYMMTAWATEPQDEHRLLGRCMVVLFRHPILLQNQLIGAMKDQSYDLQTRLASHDKLTNPAEVWGSLDNEMRPSISYIVTLAMDPWSEITSPVVQTFTFRTGQSISSPQGHQLARETAEDGTVIRGAIMKDNQPQVGIEVAVKGTGLFTTTNDDGLFALGNLPFGDYILVARPTEGKPKEVSVSVPDGNYDIEL